MRFTNLDTKFIVKRRIIKLKVFVALYFVGREEKSQ
jgi:hypothetical protein